MSYIKKLQEHWEALAKEDPLWTVCTDPEKKNKKWEQSEFFRTGEEEVRAVLAHIRKLGLNIDKQGLLLDFGCGVGRLTQAFVQHFDSCYGVDISDTMIRLAKQYNRYGDRCRYSLNAGGDLKIFPGNTFGFIYTSLVLQHMKPYLSASYIKEFGRILKPGGMVVIQLIDNANLTLFQRLKNFLRIRTRAIALIKRIILRQQRQDYAIPMYCMPEKKLKKVVKEAGLKIIDVSFTNSAQKDYDGNLYYLSWPSTKGYVSKQYICRK